MVKLANTPVKKVLINFVLNWNVFRNTCKAGCLKTTCKFESCFSILWLSDGISSLLGFRSQGPEGRAGASPALTTF